MPVKSPTCCCGLDIEYKDLIFPDGMSLDGQEFSKVHGLGNVILAELQANAMDMGNGMVKIFHRCKQLTDDGLCKIYDNRPKICKNFDCSTRSDCICKGQGHV